jgi:hypothetical protein
MQLAVQITDCTSYHFDSFELTLTLDETIEAIVITRILKAEIINPTKK